MVHAALVADSIYGPGGTMQPAYNRLVNDYNFAGYPTCFFDGGYRVLVGGYPQESYYRTRIEQCGLRTVPPLDLITAIEWLGNGDIEVHVAIGNGIPANNAPPIPATPSGITEGIPNVAYEYTANCSDPDNNDLYYQWDWGNGDISNWIGPLPSGDDCAVSYSWADNGTYDVMVKVKDVWGDMSDWSAPLTVSIGCCSGIRGNIDGDQQDQIDIADLVYFVDYSFGTPPGPEPPCFEEADVDATGALDIGDIVYLVNFMFGTPPGPAPLDCAI